MKPLQHARITARRYGGEWQDWIAIHDWIDRSKAIFPSMQRRMFLHSDFGEWLAVKIHGEAIRSKSGTVVTTRDGSVAKNGWGRKKPGLDFSLGGNLEGALHESHLSANVAFPDSFNLSYPNHVHCLEPADRPPRRLETEEAESGIDSTFDESAPLLDYVIEALGLAQLRGAGQDSFMLQFFDRGRVGFVPIYVDHLRR
jgi:hypothetical protein